MRAASREKGEQRQHARQDQQEPDHLGDGHVRGLRTEDGDRAQRGDEDAKPAAEGESSAEQRSRAISCHDGPPCDEALLS